MIINVNGLISIYDLPWFVVVYDFYPTSCVFSIPKPWQGDRKDTSSWIKIICNLKLWEILFITCNNRIFIYKFSVTEFLMSFQQYCVIIHCDIIAVVYEDLSYG